MTRVMIQRDVRAAFAELDPQQLAISRRLTSAARFDLLCDLNGFPRNAVIAAIHEQRADLAEADFEQEFLKRVGIYLSPRPGL